MKLSTRYSLTGIGALAVLSLVHLCRAQNWLLGGPSFLLCWLGVLPNFLAALAISFVMLGIWADVTPTASYPIMKHRFAVVLVFSAIGLITWEFMQQNMRPFVFDWNDLGATVVGLAMAIPLFACTTIKRVQDQNSRE